MKLLDYLNNIWVKHWDNTIQWLLVYIPFINIDYRKKIYLTEVIVPGEVILKKCLEWRFPLAIIDIQLDDLKPFIAYKKADTEYSFINYKKADTEHSFISINKMSLLDIGKIIITLNGANKSLILAYLKRVLLFSKYLFANNKIEWKT